MHTMPAMAHNTSNVALAIERMHEQAAPIKKALYSSVSRVCTSAEDFSDVHGPQIVVHPTVAYLPINISRGTPPCAELSYRYHTSQ